MQAKVRVGICALPLSATLMLLAALVPGVGIDPSADPARFSQAASNVGLSNLLGVPIAALFLVGSLALYLFLSGTQVENWCFAGFLCVLVGMVFFLPFIGIYAFVGPVAGRHYLNGDTGSIRILTESTTIGNLSAFIFGGTSVLLLTLGGIAFARALWGSQRLPKWSGILFAIGVPLSVDPLFYYQPFVWLAGGTLVLASTVWMAHRIRSMP